MFQLEAAILYVNTVANIPRGTLEVRNLGLRNSLLGRIAECSVLGRNAF